MYCRDALQLLQFPDQFGTGLDASSGQLEVRAGAIIAVAAQQHRGRSGVGIEQARKLARKVGVRIGQVQPQQAGVRSAGLVAMEAQPSLQALLVGGAMGFRGDVPALCRGEAA